LELVLLGGFQARAAGQVIDVSGRQERALLAVLAMPPGEPRSFRQVFVIARNSGFGARSGLRRRGSCLSGPRAYPADPAS
jgi:hypothetical protein